MLIASGRAALIERKNLLTRAISEAVRARSTACESPANMQPVRRNMSAVVVMLLNRQIEVKVPTHLFASLDVARLIGRATNIEWS
jgi:hypothetical protein